MTTTDHLIFQKNLQKMKLFATLPNLNKEGQHYFHKHYIFDKPYNRKYNSKQRSSFLAGEKIEPNASYWSAMAPVNWVPVDSRLGLTPMPIGART